MINFEEYLRQGEPAKAEKAQQVDGLQPSAYLLDTARQNIEGDISIFEVKERINNYYVQNPIESAENRTEEADKVSARITEILNEQTFTMSPAEYLTIHRRLFQDIYSCAGKVRDYNITKKEWILDGETVLYASAKSLEATMEYDFEQEKKFSYKNLNQTEIIKHIAHFISDLWQIHIFGEGNTRTTAIFLIKYLHKLGFKNVNNDLFEEHSWYFRNALVRANYEELSKGIYKTQKFIINFFANLLLGENRLLKNREMHVLYTNTLKQKNDTLKVQSDTLKAKIDTRNPKNDTLKAQVDTVNDTLNDTVFCLLKKNKQITAAEIGQQLKISLSTVKRKLKKLKESGKIERSGSDKTGHWEII